MTNNEILLELLRRLQVDNLIRVDLNDLINEVYVNNYIEEENKNGQYKNSKLR